MIRIENYDDISKSNIEKHKLDMQNNENSHFASTYTLKPNEKYETNCYSYETDKYGRITRCEGILRLEAGKRNTDHQVRAGGKYRLECDEGGHLIAKIFGGSEKIDNILPMNSDVNRKQYRDLERDWSNEINKGNDVEVYICCKYKGQSTRPTDFIIKYKVTEPNGFSWVDRIMLENFKRKGD